jgi:hypothetical protein
MVSVLITAYNKVSFHHIVEELIDEILIYLAVSNYQRSRVGRRALGSAPESNAQPHSTQACATVIVSFRRGTDHAPICTSLFSTLIIFVSVLAWRYRQGGAA